MSDDFRSMVESAYEQAETTATPAAAEQDVADVLLGQSADVAGSVPQTDAAGTEALGADDGSAERGVSGRVRDASGKFAKATEAKTQAPKVAEPSKTKAATAAPSPTDVSTPAVGGDSSPAPAAAAEPALKAPQSLTPLEREHFAKAPAEIQKALVRIDQTTRQALQESAPARKHYEQYHQAMAPFLPMLQAQGIDPLQQTTSLLQTAFRLQHGTPQDRARIIGDIFRQYPADLETLAKHIDGNGAPPEQGQQTQAPPGSLVDQVWQGIQQRMQQHSMSTATQQGQAAVHEWLESAKPEFLDDVREGMQFRMQAAAQRGVSLTLQQAYDTECWAHPEVRTILQKRQAADAAKAQAASTQQARLAATSVKSNPSTGAGSASAPRNHRDIVSAAYETLDRR